jgi:hypothetical protein
MRQYRSNCRIHPDHHIITESDLVIALGEIIIITEVITVALIGDISRVNVGHMDIKGDIEFDCSFVGI